MGFGPCWFESSPGHFFPGVHPRFVTPGAADLWYGSGLEWMDTDCVFLLRPCERDVAALRAVGGGPFYSTANSFLRVFIWALSRARMDECICETRDSDRSSVAPISFIVISS